MATTNTVISSPVAPALKRRLICMVYEAMLLFGVIFTADMIFDVWTQSRHALTLRHAREAWLFAILGIYFVFFWCRSGQTLAMKTWNIKLIDGERQKLPVIKAIVRYCLAWMWFIPGLAIAYQFELKGWLAIVAVTANIILWVLTYKLDKDGQFLHDKLAKTRLVHAEVKLSNDTRFVD